MHTFWNYILCFHHPLRNSCPLYGKDMHVFWYSTMSPLPLGNSARYEKDIRMYSGTTQCTLPTPPKFQSTSGMRWVFSGTPQYPPPHPLKIPPVWERYGYVLKDMELHAECTLPTLWKFQTPAYVRYGYLLDYMFSHILHVPDLILRVSYNTEESLAVDQGQLTYFELNSDFTS